jgi:ABC-type polysaccharide/polyol phosphate export permease
VAATTTAVGPRPRSAFSERLRWAGSTWDLLFAITLRDLRVKYSRTVFSYFWWIARPLTLGLVLYFALDRVLKLGVENYGVFLLSGLFPWFWFQSTLIASTSAFTANAGLLKKVRFPRPVLPLSMVLAGAFEFGVTLPVLLGIVLASGIDPSWVWLPGIVVLAALQLALLAGLAMLASCLNVFFRDLAPSLEATTLLLFYMTPIIYPLDEVPDSVHPFLLINPLVPLIEAWRELFLDGSLPGIELWPAALFAAIALVAGVWLLKRVAKALPDAL